MLVASLDLSKNNIRKFKYYARLGMHVEHMCILYTNSLNRTFFPLLNYPLVAFKTPKLF